MIKKLVKYAKIAIAMALIASLTLPSYATVGASDGSAFVTKAEFDVALSDFNARLTTFEAGINSKIDSQVTSYLDRNGIWNGAKQELWDFRFATDDFAKDYRNRVASLSLDESNIVSTIDNSSTNWSCAMIAGGKNALPLVYNISKSGLLAYNIPMLYFSGNAITAFAAIDICLTFVQTTLSNIASSTGTSAVYLQDVGQNYLKSPLDGVLKEKITLNIPNAVQVVDTTQATYFTSNFMPAWMYSGIRVQNYHEKLWNEPVTDAMELVTQNSRTYEGVTKYYYYDTPIEKNVYGYTPWSGNYEAGTLKLLTGSNLSYMITVFSGYTFVSKDKVLLFCPAAGGGWIWTSKTVPVTDNWLRTSGELLKLDVY